MRPDKGAASEYVALAKRFSPDGSINTGLNIFSIWRLGVNASQQNSRTDYCSGYKLKKEIIWNRSNIENELKLKRCNVLKINMKVD